MKSGLLIKFTDVYDELKCLIMITYSNEENPHVSDIDIDDSNKHLNV